MCFALREVSVSDGGNSVPVVWTSRLAGSNKPSNTRPLALFPAKEDVELLKEFIPIVEAEIKEMENGGYRSNGPKMPVLGQIWPFLGPKSNFLGAGNKNFGTLVPGFQ